MKHILSFNPTLHKEGMVVLGTEIKRLNAFRCALELGHLEIARLLVHAGYDVTKEKYLWTNENLPQSLVLNFDFWLELQRLISQPTPLKELSRRLLRRNLGYKIRIHLDEINLPPFIKRILLT